MADWKKIAVFEAPFPERDRSSILDGTSGTNAELATDWAGMKKALRLWPFLPSGHDQHLAVSLESWSEADGYPHPEMEKMRGKRVRVTIEIEDA